MHEILDSVTAEDIAPRTSKALEMMATWLHDPQQHANMAQYAVLQVNCECPDRLIHEIHPGG